MEARNEAHGMGMAQLPDDVVLEVIKRLSSYDAVRFGATCREYRALAHGALKRREVQRTVIDSFSYVIHILMTQNRFVHTGRAGFVGHVYRIPPSNETYSTRALYLCPSMWSTYLHGSLMIDDERIPVMISISLTVILRQNTRDWDFRFRMNFAGDNASMLYDEFPESVLYQLTTKDERRNAAVILLSSWYGHVQETLAGRRLRSYKHKGWLPPRLPSLYYYVRAAYAPLRAFICNLE